MVPSVAPDCPFPRPCIFLFLKSLTCPSTDRPSSSPHPHMLSLQSGCTWLYFTEKLASAMRTCVFLT